ncbi:MAG: hypothetical protein H6Q90_606 [Deltaproteobacteria bacterium]|nr:hypothetical protein [Deltaproteobacteria bacterium]
MRHASLGSIMLRPAALVVLLVGCADAGIADDSEVTSEAPLIGVDGSHDQADRSCNVVLRDLRRNSIGFSYESVGSSWVWQGTVEISEAALGEGLVPQVLYQSGSDPAWHRATATPVSEPATPGYARFTVRLTEGLPGPGMSGTALGNTRIQVVPYLPLAAGGRLFDHNRHPSDFDNYLVTSPEFAISSAAAVCAPPAGPTRAKLTFAADFSERREGVLAPGGDVTISYDPARLPTCRNGQGGNPLWDITAHVQFEPGGERRDVSVRDAAATLAVPATARGVTLWFENTSTSGCQTWDSNLGQNYHFNTLTPPQWMGEVRNLITRDGDDACDGGGLATLSFNFGTWARQRAFHTNLCFQVYEPGLTDRDDPDLWQALDVSLHYRFVGQTAWTTLPVNFDRRTGNNARYRMSWRELDPFRTYHCPEVAPHPSQDGMYAEVQLEYYIVVNGGELRPAPGAAFAATFADYPDGFWHTGGCGL